MSNVSICATVLGLAVLATSGAVVTLRGEGSSCDTSDFPPPPFAAPDPGVNDEPPVDPDMRAKPDPDQAYTLNRETFVSPQCSPPALDEKGAPCGRNP
ncbi:MAG TPA: hypothetical protein VK524_28325 [Polyangiaceae bacterium]|nr:hypothetical protein [Polyangiaceae bacterium]